MSAAKRPKKSRPDVVDLTQDDSIIVNDGSDKNLVVITLDDTDDVLVETVSDIEYRQPAKRHKSTNSLGATSKPPKPVRPPPRPETPPNTPKCPICIETYQSIKKRGLKVVTTRCGHIFCDLCLKKAISVNGRKCPKCRKNLPKGPTAMIEIFDVC